MNIEPRMLPPMMRLLLATTFQSHLAHRDRIREEHDQDKSTDRVRRPQEFVEDFKLKETAQNPVVVFDKESVYEGPRPFRHAG
jgi:hypothetical protein